MEFQSSDYSYGTNNPDILSIIATEQLPSDDDLEAGAGALALNGGISYYTVTIEVEDHTLQLIGELRKRLWGAFEEYTKAANKVNSAAGSFLCPENPDSFQNNPNLRSPKVTEFRTAWINLVDNILSVLRFLKGMDVFCPEDVDYFKKNLCAAINPVSWWTLASSDSWQQFITSLFNQLTALIGIGKHGLENDQPASGLNPTSFDDRVATFEISHTFQNGYANEPSHGNAEITGYSYFPAGQLTANINGLPSVSYSNYAKRVNQEVLRFSDVNAARTNTYGFLSPLQIEYSVGSDNRVILNELSSVEQTLDLLQAVFDPAGSMAQGNPVAAKQTILEYSSVKVVKRSKSLAARAQEGNSAELLDEATAAADELLSEKFELNLRTQQETLSRERKAKILAEGESAHEVLSSVALDADSEDYLGDESEFIHQDEVDDQDTDSPEAHHSAEDEAISALGSQPTDMILLSIAYTGIVGDHHRAPEYIGTNSIAGSLMAADLVLLKNPNEYTVAFSGPVGDSHSGDSGIGA